MRESGNDWCALDDTTHRLWYNTRTGQLTRTRPAGAPLRRVQAGPIRPTNPALFSRFEYLDECASRPFAEYIEPLVSQLRHPLNGCHLKDGSGGIVAAGQDNARLMRRNQELRSLVVRNEERSHLVPTPQLQPQQRAYYFDAGASDWFRGIGGASLSYFTSMWARNGIDFDQVEAWEGTTSLEKFRRTVPAKWASRVRHHQAFVAASASASASAAPFPPTVIRRTTTPADYVLFKLDVDNVEVEQGIIDHLLSDAGAADITHVDELAWEHHVRNPWMDPWWNSGATRGAIVLNLSRSSTSSACDDVACARTRGSETYLTRPSD